MPTAKQRFSDISKAVYWITGGLILIELLITSGLSVNLVNTVISRAKGGQASFEDFFTLIDVAVRAFPIVAAILVSYAVVKHSGLGGIALVNALAVTWVAAAFLAAAGDPTTAGGLPDIDGGNPLALLVSAVGATFTPYTPILAAQGVIVGGSSLVVFEWLSKKWAAEDADEATRG